MVKLGHKLWVFAGRLARAARPAHIAAVAILALAVVAGGFSYGWAERLDRQAEAAGVVSAARQAAADRAEHLELMTLTSAPSVAVNSYEAAQLFNASLPYSSAPIRAAGAFNLTAASAQDRQEALNCLTQAVYYEAGFEPLDGRQAVAQVVLNRVRHPAFPNSVCGVVFEGAGGPVCQFSFACDGAMNRAPAPAAWREARRIAQAALDGYVMAGVGRATHYHTDWVAPAWGPRLTKIRQIGDHIFYRWPGGWGEPAAFTSRYSGIERPFVPGDEGPGAAELTLAQVTAEPAPEIDITDRHAPTDIGGRVDMEKGWTPNIPLPSGVSSRLSAAASSQELASARDEGA
jgi:spore germination cell wall hydrolase CwlJ-like protein